MGILDDGASGREREMRVFGLSLKHASLLTITLQNSAYILILHYSRITPPPGDHRYFPSTAILLAEIIKLFASLSIVLHSQLSSLTPGQLASASRHPADLFTHVYHVVFSRDSWKLAIPATLYTLQNSLLFIAISNLDAVHYQVLYQLKILTTAVFSVLLLRRSLGARRWVALVILTLGVSIVSLPPETDLRLGPMIFHDSSERWFPSRVRDIGQVSAKVASRLARRSASYRGMEEDAPPPIEMNRAVGITAVLTAALVSGLAGVTFEKVLKDSSSTSQGGGPASLWVRNVQLSFYSLVPAGFGVLWTDGQEISEHGFFDGYTWVVWTAIIVQAAGGMLASMCIRYADNISKNFATSFSIILSFLFSVVFFNFTTTFSFLLGTSLVLGSAYMYSLVEQARRPSPPIRIASFEKPAIDRSLTPRSTDESRLQVNPFDAKSLGLSTSRPSSPMLPRSASGTRIKTRDE